MKQNNCIWMIMVLIGLFLISTNVKMVQAEDYSYLVEMTPSLYELPKLDKEGNTTIWWSAVTDGSMYETVTIGYEFQIAKNKEFTNAKQYTTKEASITLNKSEFGNNGGKFYGRVRLIVDYLDETKTDLASEWSKSQEMIFVKINKTNFPGMYSVLKNGGKYSSLDGAKKIDYDKNDDGWLDPAEINDIWILGTCNVTKKVNGKYKTTKAPNISSFKGIEYLTNLSNVSIARYSGKTADLSKCSVGSVWIDGITAKQFTLNAPSAKTVHVEADYGTKMTKMDLSKCGNVIDLDAYGNEGTKTLKLPKNKKKLKILSLSEIGLKSINLNEYTNLQQVYFYECDAKSIKVNKCKKLRYIYFYFCDNIKSLNLKSNTKLRGADFYKTPGLTKSTVKRPKNGKYTWNQGKWWYKTSAYKKDMEKISES